MDTISQNVRALIQESGGPLTALSTLCREASLQFFPRVRMNSHYEIDPRNPAYGRFRRERPHLLISQPHEEPPEGSLPWGLGTGKDYAFPEVRDYMASIIIETFKRFDVDGVELDFMRHPGCFRPEQAFQNRYLMTDLIERVRHRLDEVAAERNNALKLAVRVPPTLYDSARIGLDVEQWIRRELVDMVIVGGGFIPFETPIREFVEAAQGSHCLIYGCIEATRHIDDAAVRALAARWISHGAAGIYLYNFYTMYPEWNQRIAQDLSDPSRLDRLDKRYELDRAGPLHPSKGHGGAFRYASPSTQLPVTLRPAPHSGGPRFTIEITDDLASASADGAPRSLLDHPETRRHSPPRRHRGNRQRNPPRSTIRQGRSARVDSTRNHPPILDALSRLPRTTSPRRHVPNLRRGLPSAATRTQCHRGSPSDAESGRRLSRSPHQRRDRRRIPAIASCQQTTSTTRSSTQETYHPEAR